MYLYIYIHMHTCICTYMYTYVYICICLYIYVCIHKYICIYTYLCIHVYIEMTLQVEIGWAIVNSIKSCTKSCNSRVPLGWPLCHLRTRSFLETGFWPLYPSFVWFVPLSRTQRVFFISTIAARSFLVAGFDTHVIPRSFSCGLVYRVTKTHRIP